jgi:hypothetical protein
MVQLVDQTVLLDEKIHHCLVAFFGLVAGLVFVFE